MLSHRFLELFCFSSKCQKGDDKGFNLCLVVNVQSVTNHYGALSKMVKPGVIVFVYLCGARSCIASRDPYCGWKSSGACERIQSGVL